MRALLTLQVFPFIIALLFLLPGCANYYKEVTPPLGSNNERAATLEMLKSEDRVFILREGNKAFLMQEPVIKKELHKIDCRLDTLSSLHKLHLGLGRKGKMQYKKKIAADKAVLKEVHIYTDPGNDVNLGNFSLSFEKIDKVEVLIKDKNKTGTSYFFGGAGILAGLGLAAIIIFIAAYNPKE